MSGVRAVSGASIQDMVNSVAIDHRYHPRLPGEQGFHLVFHDGSELLFTNQTPSDVDFGAVGIHVRDRQIGIVWFFAHTSFAFAYFEANSG